MAKAQHATRYRPLPPLPRRMRQSSRLTQRQLASKLRMSNVAVHKSETGDRRVDLAEFVDWCIACGADPVESVKAFCRMRGV